MARPERHDVDYFPFYVKDGRTLFILESKYGCMGTGFFTNVMRFLCQTPDHHFCIQDKVVDAINKLKSRGFKQNQIRCYVLIGFDMREEHDRLIELLKAGCLPFAQLYQPEQKREYDYNGNSFKECGADQRYTNH